MSSLGSRGEMGPDIERTREEVPEQTHTSEQSLSPSATCSEAGALEWLKPDTLHSQGFLVMLGRTRDVGALLSVCLKGNSACDSPAAKVLPEQCSREKLPDTLCKWRQQGQSPREVRTGEREEELWGSSELASKAAVIQHASKLLVFT